LKNVVITGSAGGIGVALTEAFAAAGYRVIGIDLVDAKHSSVHHHVQADFERLVSDRPYRDEICAGIRAHFGTGGLAALVNNAATQRTGSFEALTTEDWQATLNVNLMAPMLLIREFLPELTRGRGSVINIASIHAKLTKPRFSAYATSKSALIGLTRALAVEFGGRIRVNAICPAAIATPMLEAGFAEDPEGLKRLKTYHPSGCIGVPDDVARAALYLAEAQGTFLTGATIALDGGIGARLHDPV
jgi:NAD(P)-dependent dehydrogenase (short-subunit alcohol dehydrogenase family)